jgi:hypothetical protein
VVAELPVVKDEEPLIKKPGSFVPVDTKDARLQGLRAYLDGPDPGSFDFELRKFKQTENGKVKSENLGKAVGIVVRAGELIGFTNAKKSETMDEIVFLPGAPRFCEIAEPMVKVTRDGVSFNRAYTQPKLGDKVAFVKRGGALYVELHAGGFEVVVHPKRTGLWVATKKLWTAGFGGIYEPVYCGPLVTQLKLTDLKNDYAV